MEDQLDLDPIESNLNVKVNKYVYIHYHHDQRKITEIINQLSYSYLNFLNMFQMILTILLETNDEKTIQQEPINVSH